MALEYPKEKNKCIRMAFMFSRFASYKKYLGILAEQLNK